MSVLPPFELHRSASAGEATSLLERLGEDAVPICGGTELLLLMKLGFGRFDHLVDISRVDELRHITVEGGELVIGAAATHREIERSAVVAEALPALAAMERTVANVRVRSAGTIGGNLCFADPHSDPATFLLALDARLVVGSGRGLTRELSVSEFLLGPYSTALERGELLLAVRIPLPPAGTGIAHRKIAFQERPAATVTAAVLVEGGRIARARLAVGSVGAAPVRTPGAEELLTGLPAGLPADALAAAAEKAAAESGALPDESGTTDYPRNLVRVLMGRAVRDAVARAAT